MSVDKPVRPASEVATPEDAAYTLEAIIGTIYHAAHDDRVTDLIGEFLTRRDAEVQAAALEDMKNAMFALMDAAGSLEVNGFVLAVIARIEALRALATRSTEP